MILELKPQPFAARRRAEPARRTPWALHIAVAAAFALGGAVALSAPLSNVASGATTVPAAWVWCTNATLSSGTCVPGYGSAVYNGQNGYYGQPATLSGPEQLYLSPVFCPAGSEAAKSGESCSAPFQLSLSKVNLAPAIGVIRVVKLGYESSAGINAGAAVAVLDNPLAVVGSDPAAQWCVAVPTNANPAGETCVAESNTSLPVYLAASTPPVLGTVLMCVGGEVSPTQSAFEACIQSSVSTKPFAATKARSTTIRKIAVKKKQQTSPVSVTLSAPAISGHVLAVGASVNIVVTVTPATGSLTQATLSTGLTPGTGAVVTTTKPQFTGVTTSANGVTNGFKFTFSVKALQAGNVTVDVAAAAQLSTGTSVTGAAQLAVTVG
jgi:hypothetical protein